MINIEKYCSTIVLWILRLRLLWCKAQGLPPVKCQSPDHTLKSLLWPRPKNLQKRRYQRRRCHSSQHVSSVISPLKTNALVWRTLCAKSSVTSLCVARLILSIFQNHFSMFLIYKFYRMLIHVWTGISGIMGLEEMMASFSGLKKIWKGGGRRSHGQATSQICPPASPALNVKLRIMQMVHPLLRRSLRRSLNELSQTLNRCREAADIHSLSVQVGVQK